jgi:aminoglycoside phosphotransferase (APT) family kinase protein
MQMPDEGDISTRVADELLKYVQGQPGLEGAKFSEPPRRLTGGFETLIYAFRLAGVPSEFNGPLVVRIFPGPGGAGQAHRETAYQNALADVGYPAPMVLLPGGSHTLADRAFNVMERVAGNSLMDALFTNPADAPGIADQLAETLVELHSIPIDGVANKLKGAGISVDGSSSNDNLRHLQRYTADPLLTHLDPGVAWLLENQPSRRDALSVCHGDYHPGNVMAEDGRVTGVLDWPGAQIADPEHDVAVSLVLVAVAAPGLSGDIPAEAFQMFADAFLDSYNRRRSLDDARLSYYKAYRLLRAFLHGSAARTPGVSADLQPRDQYPWAEDGAMRRLVSNFRDITDIDLPLPAGVDTE